MKRFYYISDDLDDLEKIEHELEAGGIARPQIYLLSNDDVGLENRDVNRVASFLKTDVIHAGEIGAVLGLAVGSVILLVSHFSGIAAQVGWAPFIFLAIIGFGFATWEAGFIGMQIPNVHFTRFEKALEQGRHVLFVETDREDQKKLKAVIKKYPGLERAGTEVTHTRALMLLLKYWERFRSWALVFQGRPKRQQ
ncbi:MAG: NAD/FAD-utilizing enzyme [Luminiphilus sp.]|jgi:hypothetical protein